MMNPISSKMIKGIMMVCLVVQVVCGEQEIRCIQSERQALLQFKASILDYGGLLSSWTTNDCCQWMGIRCSNLTGHVLMLDLHGETDYYEYRFRYYRITSQRYIRGEIHKSLMELQQLQYLNLSLNSFQGSHIPEFFASLTNLRYLDLSFSHFGGKISSQFGSLSHLKYLNLAGNFDLEGSIPYQLGNLSNLQHLDLSDNSLEGKIPSQLGNLSNLQYLDLRYNSLKGNIPSQLGKLSNLQTLYLGGNSALKIHDGDQARGQWLSNLTSLTHLYLWSISNLNSSHSWLQMIAKLPKLRELSLYNCSLSNHLILSLGHSKFNFSTSLSVLDLSGNSFTSPMIFQWVSNITSNLVELDLSSNFLDASASNHLATKMVKLPKLRELRLVNCNLSDNFLHSMAPSKFNFSTSLSILDLSLNTFTSSMIFQWLSNVSSNLIKLDLSSNNLLVGSTSNHVGIMMNSLEQLDLSYNSLKSGVLNSFMNICTLHSLNMNENNLTEDLASILHNLSGGCVRNSLQELDLSYNHIIGSLIDLSVFSSLKSLDLSDNCLSGKIPESSKLPPQLESLSIQSNSLEGGVPISFGNACDLDTLDLSYNKLNKELPVIINHLSGCARYTLQELNLNGNEINGTLPDLSIFSILKTLYLSQNQLTGKIPKGNKLPSELESLSIQSNTLEGGIPKSFGNACTLHSLDMSDNSLSEELPMIIHHLSGCARYSLQELDLRMNRINGTLPNNLSMFSSLRELHLDENKLNGRIPEDIQFPTQLEELYMNSNSLEGVITESHFSNMSKLNILELSDNSLTLEFAQNWIPPFQLYNIGLRSCKLGPTFPKWLQTQNKFYTLDISSSGISDIVPEWFWAKFKSLLSINISYNNLQGTIPNLPLQNSYDYDSLSLASNQFEGPIPPFLRYSKIIDLSKNKFSHSQSFLCASYSVKTLRNLDLSNNQLFGQIPNCWSHFKSLVYVDLSHNNFSGKFPTSIGLLIELQALLLRNNSLSEEMPFSLSNCTNLVMLDAGENRLSGAIPSWIGSKLIKLQVLSLQGNHFSGSLPLQMCYLQNLQLLDLSFNNLSGEIPKCVKNFTSMTQDTSSRYYENHKYYNFDSLYNRQAELYTSYKLKAFVMWKGAEEMFMNQTLYLLKSIDLSSNQLSEEIPTEIESLLELVSLNLSRNNLTGKIPSNIGRLISLEFLDLSRNQISGPIPTSLTQIDRLAMLDLSHNLLYGKIPTGTQLQSFNASSYADNLDLCGKPLAKLCIEEKPQQNPIDKSLNDEHSFFSRGFYMSMALGFVIGFWGSFGSILIKRSWRHAYFKFLNKVADNIYIRVVMTCAKIPKLAKGR